MIATDLVRFALHALLAVLIFLGSVRIAQLVAIEVVFGAAEAFFRPAADGVLPQTVAEPDIQQATAITTMSNNFAEFAGPTLATALVLGAGAGWAFALDSATFLLSAAFLTRVRPRARGAQPAVALMGAAAGATAAAPPTQAAATPLPMPPPRRSVWAEIRAGSREVRARVWVWATLASFSVALFAGLAPWFVLGPSIARQQYGHLFVYGVIEGSIGFGTIVGSLAGIGWRPRHPMRMAMLAMLVWPLDAILYATGVTLVIVVPATVLAGVGIALFNVWWLTALAERIPPGALSRVSSFDWMVSYALLPIGYIAAGPLAERLGAVTVVIAGSALAFVAFVLGLAPRQTRMLERLTRSSAPASPCSPR